MGLNNYVYAFHKSHFETSKQEIDSFIDDLVSQFNAYYNMTYRPTYHKSWNDLNRVVRKEFIKFDPYLKEILQLVTNYTCESFKLDENDYVLHEKVKFINYLSNIWNKSDNYMTIHDWRKNYELDWFVRNTICNEEAFSLTQEIVEVIREEFPDIGIEDLKTDTDLVYTWVSSP